MAGDIVSSISGLCDIAEKTGACVLRHLNYVFKIRDALQDAEPKVSTLKSKRDDLQLRVERDEHLVNHRPRQEVVSVLKQIGDAVSEFESLNADILRDTDDTCCFCSFSFSKLRNVYGYGKRLDRLMKVVLELTDRCGFEEVATEQPPSKVVEVPTLPLYGRQITVNKALDSIRDQNVTAIGIYGMGGIGKTTILQEINNKLSSADEFEFVIWVDVFKDVDMSKIINCIGRRLGLSKDFEKWKGETQEKRRSDVYGRLSRTKFVLLLDNVWARMDLQEIGVPFLKPPSHSKIVLTSRELDVCKVMGAQKRFKVECLRKEDAWELFSNKVGEETLNAHPDIPALAEQVCDRVSGFPLLLTTLGRTMAYQTTVAEWEYMLSRLNISILEEKDILATLQLSYDILKNKPTKLCFIYICFYAKINVALHEDDLVQQLFAVGLLGDNYNDALKLGHHIIRQLQSASLCDVLHVENYFHEVYYKMHDVIIEMGHQVIRQGRMNFRENFPTESCANEVYQEAEKIFICDCAMEALDKPPICPNLSTLVMCENRDLLTVHEGFFNSVSQLRVLSLYGCYRLKSLPNGINLLTRLRYLNIGGTGIETMPENFQDLKELQVLRTNDYLRFPQGVLSNFKKLLVFEYGRNDFMRQPLEIEKLKELSGLTQLTSLVLPPFEPFSENFKYFITSKNLLKCTSIIALRGRRTKDGISTTKDPIDLSFLSDMTNLTSIALYGFDNGLALIPSSPSRRPVFKSIVSLSIYNCNGIEDISYLLLSMSHLEYLYVSGCGGIKAILKKEGSGQIIDADTRGFSRLQTLTLRYMCSLEYISPDNQQFPCLKTIKVTGCKRLHKLPFNPSNAGKLSSIKGDQRWFDDLQWENEESRFFASDKFRTERKFLFKYLNLSRSKILVRDRR